MRLGRGWRLGVAVLWVAGSGCTALREIPRGQYVERVPERPVRVVTAGGESYEFESARIEADTLVGHLRRDVEGPIEEFETLRLPLEGVASISARRIDWYRTGLAAGAVAVAVTVAVVRAGSGGTGSAADDDGKEPPPLP